jgi:hypothetical protein
VLRDASGVPTDEYLSSEQVAGILNIHAVTARRRFANCPGVYNIGRGKNKILRIPRSVVQRFLIESDVVGQKKSPSARVCARGRFK